MAKLMKCDQLLESAARAGIRLVDAAIRESNLYVFTDPEEHTIYIGKAASQARHRDEARWATLDYESQIVAGFTALINENEARSRPLRYDPASFDFDLLRTHIAVENWTGGAVDIVTARLDAKQPPTVEEVEQILIRIHVRTGRLIGNSQFASQWENPIGSFADTVAVLAADAARTSGIFPRQTTVATEGVEAKDRSARR